VSALALAAYLLARAEGTIGEIVTLLIRVATRALGIGQESIDRAVLEAVEYMHRRFGDGCSRGY
jgi:hypothetical protein